MAVVPLGLADRARNIIVTPKTEWPVIDAEPTSIGDICRSYVLPLAAIPAVAGLIGNMLIGVSVRGITVKVSPLTAVTAAIIQYAMALITVFLLALIIDVLAPSFGGVRDQRQAFKVAAYSGTAFWLGGIVAILPLLGPIGGLIGLYGLYLLYLGLPRLMRSPADRTIGYAAATIAAALLLLFAGHLLVRNAGGLFAPSITVTDATVTQTVTMPAGTPLDLARLGAGAREADDIARGVRITDNGTVVPAVSPSSLLALLPGKVGDYHRTEIASSGVETGRLGGAHAEARYEHGDNVIRLALTDMAVAGRVVAAGAGPDSQASHEGAVGYAATRSASGRLVSETWDRSSKRGRYSELVAKRFLVEADGQVGDVSELKRAARAISHDALAALAD